MTAAASPRRSAPSGHRCVSPTERSFHEKFCAITRSSHIENYRSSKCLRLTISDAAIPLGSKAEARTQAAGRVASKTSPNRRDPCPLAIERLGEILRDPKAKDGAVIRAAELLLERGFGSAPVFRTNDPGEFRDVMAMSDAEISERLAVLRGILLENGIDPLRLPSRRATEGRNRPQGGRAIRRVADDALCQRAPDAFGSQIRRRSVRQSELIRAATAPVRNC